MISTDEYGHFEITLEEILKKRCKSKNFLEEKANLQRTQLNTYCKGNIKRPDFDVLARICFALECDISDIIRYVRPQQKNGENKDGR